MSNPVEPTADGNPTPNDPPPPAPAPPAPEPAAPEPAAPEPAAPAPPVAAASAVPDQSALDGDPVPPPLPPKNRTTKLLLAVAGVVILLVALVFGVLMLREDRTKEAKAGDCIASDEQVSRDSTTKTGARVVSCSSAEAEFTVVGRVDGQTDLTGDSCQQFFKSEKDRYFVYASDSDGGYVLCLQAKA